MLSRRRLFRIGMASRMVRIALHFGVVAVPCFALVACAVPGLLAAYTIFGAGAAAGVLGVGVVAGEAAFAFEKADADRCQGLVDSGLAVTEEEGLTVPYGQQNVVVFEPVYWWPATAPATHRSVMQPEDATKGLFAVTEHAALLVAPTGALGLRYPYESVARVDVDPVNPHWLVLSSSCGRFDILAFSRRDPSRFDPDGAAAAAKAIKTHVARVRARD